MLTGKKKLLLVNVNFRLMLFNFGAKINNKYIKRFLKACLHQIEFNSRFPRKGESFIQTPCVPKNLDMKQKWNNNHEFVSYYDLKFRSNELRQNFNLNICPGTIFICLYRPRSVTQQNSENKTTEFSIQLTSSSQKNFYKQARAIITIRISSKNNCLMIASIY